MRQRSQQSYGSNELVLIRHLAGIQKHPVEAVFFLCFVEVVLLLLSDGRDGVERVSLVSIVLGELGVLPWQVLVPAVQLRESIDILLCELGIELGCELRLQ